MRRQPRQTARALTEAKANPCTFALTATVQGDMAYQRADRAFIDYQTYRWGRLGQEFRGPPPDLDRPYIACIGGGRTFGRYAAQPYPALLADGIGRQVANFGAADAGPGFFLSDSMVLEALCDAALCVVEVMSAQALSNRLYQVDPVRNAAIGRVSPALRALFPHVGDDVYAFARALLDDADRGDPAAFEAVEAELKTAWTARMRRLLGAIQCPKVLLWFSGREPDAPAGADPRRAALSYPHHVDRAMLDALSPLVEETVFAISPDAPPQSLLVDGAAALHTPFGIPIRENRAYPTPAMHRAAATALAPVADRILSASPDF